MDYAKKKHSITGLILVGLIILLSSLWSQACALSWSTHQLIVDNNEVHGASISMDSNANWHVVYQTYSYPVLVKYVSSTGGQSIITQSPYVSMGYPSIAVDSNDRIHITYVTNSGVRYTNNKSGSWSTHQLIVGNSEVHGASISVDSNGS